MTSITISNVDEQLKRRLELRAAQHGRSIEDEAREILRHVVGNVAPAKNLGQKIHARFAALGGVELALPERKPMREPPRLA